MCNEIRNKIDILARLFKEDKIGIATVHRRMKGLLTGFVLEDKQVAYEYLNSLIQF